MSEAYLGEIRAFGFQFNPKDWALCNGQLMPINQYQALFAVLGTQYGGDGVTTFALPDLRGRVGLGVGPANPVVGQALGEEVHTLTSAEMPTHSHGIGAQVNGTTNATNVPSATVTLASATSDQAGNPAVYTYGTGTPTTAMLPLSTTAGGVAHENRMPFLVMNYCIALFGIFPSRN